MELPPNLEAKFSELLSRYPIKRSALIPMMLYAQDQFGNLGDDILEEIAGRLDLNITEVTETLAYYSMLHRKPTGKFHVQVCTNISCMLRGGNDIYKHLQTRLEIGNKETTATGTFSLEEVECIGACTGAPAMQVNYDYYENLDNDQVDEILEQLQVGKKPQPVPQITGAIKERDPAEVPVISWRWGIPNSRTLDVYRRNDGYLALEKALKEMTPDQIIDEVKKSNLRGRGGAGFPTGMKWSFVPKETGGKPKYILCNADESEPGTCKDRPLMELDPHQLIEGVVIAGRAVNAAKGYIYIRGEYRYVLDIVDAALEEAYARGYIGKNILGSGFDFDVVTHTGAGA
jgi:NADH-quinone oxidoreductase E subunit